MDANKKGSERCPLIRKGKHRVLAFVFFLIYFAVLFYFLFFSEEMGRTYSERAYHYNLIPFHVYFIVTDLCLRAVKIP